MREFQGIVHTAYTWYSNSAVATPMKDPEHICASRDIFQARLDSMFYALDTLHAADAASLCTAVVGEIGNNCFDHNIGQWQDQPGCWFTYITHGAHIRIIIADRGRGIRASLQRVDPTIQDDQQALRIAFEKKLSGRAPEQRGNGLKFVRSIINGSTTRGLYVCSGAGKMAIGTLGHIAQAFVAGQEKSIGQGTFTVLTWNT